MKLKIIVHRYAIIFRRVFYRHAQRVGRHSASVAGSLEGVKLIEAKRASWRHICKRRASMSIRSPKIKVLPPCLPPYRKQGNSRDNEKTRDNVRKQCRCRDDGETKEEREESGREEARAEWRRLTFQFVAGGSRKKEGHMSDCTPVLDYTANIWRRCSCNHPLEYWKLK